MMLELFYFVIAIVFAMIVFAATIAIIIVIDIRKRRKMERKISDFDRILIVERGIVFVDKDN